MKRRKFIKNLGGYTSSVVALPYLLPSGRLFAPTGKRLAKHVVFCLYAGGIRNYESIDKRDGNLMPHVLKGTESISADIREGMDQLPLPDGKPLQEFGTLFKGFRYNSDVVLHFTGHAAAITGNYSKNVEMMRPLPHPTVFEYFRKHGPEKKSALSTWWISDQAGPFPFLNVSSHPDYGPRYGANFLQPSSFFETDFNHLKLFSNEERANIDSLTTFFNQRFRNQIPSNLSHIGIKNTDEDRHHLANFIKQLSEQHFHKEGFDIWGLGDRVNGDMVNAYTAIEVLKQFKPELLVLNMQKSDIGHSNFTAYCNNIRKADLAVYNLWQSIQDTPGLKDDTVLIIAPEFGRNREPNSILDSFGRLAVDHTGDELSKQIFCLVVGPPDIINQNLVVDSNYGDTLSIVPTIAELLGFRENIPPNLITGKPLSRAFVS